MYMQQGEHDPPDWKGTHHCGVHRGREPIIVSNKYANRHNTEGEIQLQAMQITNTSA